MTSDVNLIAKKVGNDLEVLLDNNATVIFDNYFEVCAPDLSCLVSLPSKEGLYYVDDDTVTTLADGSQIVHSYGDEQALSSIAEGQSGLFETSFNEVFNTSTSMSMSMGSLAVLPLLALGGGGSGGGSGGGGSDDNSKPNSTDEAIKSLTKDIILDTPDIYPINPNTGTNSSSSEDELNSGQLKENYTQSDDTVTILDSNTNYLFYALGGNDVIKGSSQVDYLYGGSGNDYLYGNGGNDTLGGDSGNDWLYGGEGEDDLYAGMDHDVLAGGQAKDWLFGGYGNDYLFGEHGDDNLYGGKGDDYLHGGSGDDFLVGNTDVFDTGNDTFSYTQANSGHDLIQDFVVGEDNILLDQVLEDYSIGDDINDWVKVDPYNSLLTLKVDVDRDGENDFSITLRGYYNINKATSGEEIAFDSLGYIGVHKYLFIDDLFATGSLVVDGSVM